MHMKSHDGLLTRHVEFAGHDFHLNMGTWKLKHFPLYILTYMQEHMCKHTVTEHTYTPVHTHARARTQTHTHTSTHRDFLITHVLTMIMEEQKREGDVRKIAEFCRTC